MLICNRFNETGLYFSKYRQLFWSSIYPVSTNSSLSNSLEFNLSIEKHFYVLNNLEELILNESFFFSDVFEKIDYTCNSFLYHDNKNFLTEQHLLDKFNLLNFLTYFKKNNIYMFKTLMFNHVNNNLLKNLNIDFLHVTLWKLLSNFITKNLYLTKYAIAKNIDKGVSDNLNLNLEFDEHDDYVFRLYDDYNSSELSQNMTSLFTNFTSDYDFNSYTLENTLEIDKTTSITCENDFVKPIESNLNSTLIYSSYFGNNFIDEYITLSYEEFILNQKKNKAKYPIKRLQSLFNNVNSMQTYDVNLLENNFFTSYTTSFFNITSYTVDSALIKINTKKKKKWLVPLFLISHVLIYYLRLTNAIF